MAYTTGTLSYLAGGPLEGSWKLWEYTSTDSVAVVTGSGYITDATAKGMGIGDFVIVANQTNPQGYILQVQSMTAASGNTAGTATLAMPAGVGGPLLATPRNIIDGGDFTVNPWQRGASFTGIANTLTYTADRWFAVGGASSSISVSQQPVTAVAGFAQALQVGRAAANANTSVINIGQVVETADSYRAQGQTVTVSFWALAGANWSPANGALNVALFSGTGTNQSAANLVAGSWTGYASLVLTPQQGSAAGSAAIAQQITTSWQRYAFTATVPAGSTQLGLLFGATPIGTAGASDFVQIMGVQLEIGSQATPFEHRDLEIELALCQRYYMQHSTEARCGRRCRRRHGRPAPTCESLIFIWLPVQMYKAPTVTVTAGSFKFNIDGAAPAAASGLTNGAAHSPTIISVVGTTTGTSGQATLLQGGGGTGVHRGQRRFLKPAHMAANAMQPSIIRLGCRNRTPSSRDPFRFSRPGAGRELSGSRRNVPASPNGRSDP